MTGESGSHAPVLFRREGHAGYVVLNRPKAINALTHEMVDLIHPQLEEWARDDDVEVVVLTGAGERGLCAGGDIVALWRSAKAGDDAAADFWAAEYRLNNLIKHYPKPYVAIMDGIVLGGGIGLSAHGETRIVTERSSIGMPETGIGYLPDVGGTWLLSRAPGETGTHLGLTAGSVEAGDAIAIGLADHYVPSDRIDGLLDALATKAPADAVAEVAEPAPDAPLQAARGWIDECYAGDDAAAIVERLRAHDAPEARAAAEEISLRSPLSVAVTLEALRRAATAGSVREVLETDTVVARGLLQRADFAEGVRAQLVDKDRSPRWQHESVSDVTRAEVLAVFSG